MGKNDTTTNDINSTVSGAAVQARDIHGAVNQITGGTFTNSVITQGDQHGVTINFGATPATSDD